MNKKIILSGIIIGLLITLSYAIYHENFTESGEKEKQPLYNLSPSAEGNDINTSKTIDYKNKNEYVEHNKGFISEKINGMTFNEQMNEIDSYVKILQDSKDREELISAAEKVKKIDVHKYYVPYRDSVAEALEEKANKISNDELENDIIFWCNNTLIDLYDTMETCFINSGVEYTRSEDTHITYRYYYITTN